MTAADEYAVACRGASLLLVNDCGGVLVYAFAVELAFVSRLVIELWTPFVTLSA